MFRSIRWYSGFGISLTATLPRLKKLEKLFSEGEIQYVRDEAYEDSKEFARKALKRAGCEVNVEGLENIPEGPVVYVCNHQSNFDIAVILYHIPKNKGFVVKKELESAGYLSRWMKLIGCVFIDRSNAKKSLSAILEGIKNIKSGQSMVVFPEGTRSKSNKMGEFKAGALKLATKPQVPIVPLTMDGTYKIMEGNKNIIKPGVVNLYVHPPIYTDNLTKEDEVELNEKIKNIIESKLSQ